MPFITAYLGKIIAFVASVLLFVVTEWYFSPQDARSRHFWSGMLFLFSLVIGLSIESAITMNNKMDTLIVSLKHHAEETEDEHRIHAVAHDYEEIASGASDTLKRWGKDSLQSLDIDLKAGYIPIAREQAPTEIASVYKDACKGTGDRGIIASNVGSIDFYFDIPAYRQQNLAARDCHVPVVRFFIYSSRRDLKLTEDCLRKHLDPTKIEDFRKCVQDLNEQLGSLCSLVVDFDRQSDRIGDAEDKLIVNNSFVAETELNPETWAARRAKATEHPDRLGAARKYFQTLRGITGDVCVGRMEDHAILSNFPQFQSIKPKPTQHLADAAFRQLMDDLGR